jgi:hypothetical protein
MEIANIQDILDKKHLKLRHYVRRSITAVMKEAEKLYNSKFDPFYSWNIGELTSSEIKQELAFRVENNQLSEKISQYDKNTLNEFSIFYIEYNKIANGRHPNNLTLQEWLIIKDNYYIELKKDNEGFYEATLYEETTPQEISNDTLTDDVITQDIQDILNTVYKCRWTIGIVEILHKDYNYRVAITTYAILENQRKKIFDIAVDRLSAFFSENYGMNEFRIGFIDDQYYIEGYLLDNLLY